MARVAVCSLGRRFADSLGMQLEGRLVLVKDYMVVDVRTVVNGGSIGCSNSAVRVPLKRLFRL